MRFRPLLVPTLVAAPAIAIMVGLCVWQLQRLVWKSELIERFEARGVAAPLTAAEAGRDLSQSEWRRVRVSGEFLHDKEMLLVARSAPGKFGVQQVGVQIVTPLRMADGETVIVNRGFVPMEQRHPSRREAGQVRGVVEVEGVVRETQVKSYWNAPNLPAKNQWFYMDVPQMRAEAGLGPSKLPGGDRWWLAANDAPNPGGWPLGGQSKVSVVNDHLQYAITWACLAIALLAVYLGYHWSNGRLTLGAAGGRRP